jgi:hypothetical protein
MSSVKTVDAATRGTFAQRRVCWIRSPVSATADNALEPVDGRATRLVLLAVGAWDRRTVTAMRCAAAMPSDGFRAVHVAIDDAVARELGLAWMASHGCGLPLEVLDDDGGVAATIAAATADGLRDYDEVVVVVGQLVTAGVLRRVLHDRTADAIVGAVDRVAGARTIRVPVRADD